jgi:coatomer subunit beta'
VVFLDWTSGEVIGRIDDVQVAQILWSPQGTTVAVVADNDKTTYLLRPLVMDGSEAEFAVVGELRETTVKSGVWLTEECLLFVAGETNKVCLTYVGGSTYETLCLSPVSSLYVLGVVDGNKVVFVDKDYKIYSVSLDQHILDYKCAIVNEQFDKAQAIFESIDVSNHSQLAVFLEQHGLPREALQITTDPEHKFNLALTLGALDVAQQVCQQQLGNLNKWRLLGDKALTVGNIPLAVKSFEAANDAESLLLIAATTCDVALLQKTSEIANKNKLNNVALYANLLMRNSSSCMAILEKENRLAEAALLARTFATDKLPEIFPKWQAKLAKTNEKLANALKPLHAPRRSSPTGSPRSSKPNPEEILLS